MQLMLECSLPIIFAIITITAVLVILHFLYEGKGGRGSDPSACSRPGASVDGQAVSIEAEQGAPGSETNPSDQPAFPARSRSAEALTCEDCLRLWELIGDVFEDEMIAKNSPSLVRDRLNGELKRAGWTISRNSDGERSEHRAGNAKAEAPHRKKNQ